MDKVSETCRVSWDEVFQKSAIEFLNVIAYSRDKAEEEKRQLENWKRMN